MEQSETNSQFNAELLCPAKPGEGAPWAFIVPVSYTHLTLPTNREV